jgi:hypothetical protein
LTADALTRKISGIWDDGSTGNCVFNPDEYAKKYRLTGDTGQLYQHWLDTGLGGGYSPCGDINPVCRWDPDEYYNMNPSARAQQPRDPLEHYKQVGLKQGLGFCRAAGVYPLLESLARLIQTKKVVTPPADILAKCTSTTRPTAAANIAAQQEVFLATTSAGITQAQAATTCSALGATVATSGQLRDAQLNGAQWCTPGWVRDSTTPLFSVSISDKCGGEPGTGVRSSTQTNITAAHCFGLKPAKGATAVVGFNAKQWSQHEGGSAGSSGASTMARWVCANRAFAERLFAGPGNSDEAYLGLNDTVCFANDSTSRDYYCRTAQEYRNGEDYSTELMDSYELSCNSLTQAFYDLSGSLTTINNLKGGIESGKMTIEQAADTLNKVYDKNSCNNPTGEMVAMCNVLRASRDKVLASSQRISSTEAGREGLYTAILAPVTQATESRARILATINNLQCSL